MTSLTKSNPHSSSVPTPNTLRCLPRNYGYVIRIRLGTKIFKKKISLISVYQTVI